MKHITGITVPKLAQLKLAPESAISIWLGRKVGLMPGYNGWDEFQASLGKEPY